MAGTDSDKTVLKFLKEKCNTFKQLFERRKVYAWMVANAKIEVGIMLLSAFCSALKSRLCQLIAKWFPYRKRLNSIYEFLKTFRDFLKEKCTRENFKNIFKTFVHQRTWQKTFAWMVANAKYGLGIMLILMFKPQLELWYSLHVAEQYFDITGWTINELWVLTLASAIIGYGVIRTIFGAVVSGKQAVWTAFALWAYWIYRDCYPLNCTFIRMDTYPQRPFTDLFALYGIVIIIRWGFRFPIYVYREYKEYKNPRKGFHYDEPLKNERNTGKIKQADETLGRTEYAKQVAKTIIETRSMYAAFAMGITGSWGSGKTSFWRLIENRLRAESDIIIIEYRPWQNHGSSVIVKDFFAVLSQRLRPYDSSLSGSVDTYTKILLDADDSTLNKIVKPIRSLFCAESTAATEFDRINAALRRIDKQIVIFIDDLDRLDKNEVLDVIRLIRNTANFANVFFVAAYDRGYIVQALEDFNRYNKEAFLEKIFQLEVPLPKFEHRRIIDHLKDILTERLDTESDRINFRNGLDALDENDSSRLYVQKQANIDQVSNVDEFPKSIFSLFQSFRDVNRFSNLFIEAYKPLKGNILLMDLFCFELLKYKYEGVYNVMFDNLYDFLDISDPERLKLKEIGRSRDNLAITQYCQNNPVRSSIDKIDIPTAVNLLQHIFSEGNNHVLPGENKRLSASNLSSVYRYGFGRLTENDISYIQFSNAFNQGYELFKVQLAQWFKDKIGISDIKRYLFDESHMFISDPATLVKSQIYFLLNNLNKIHDFTNRTEDTNNLLQTILLFPNNHPKYKEIYVEFFKEALEFNQFSVELNVSLSQALLDRRTIYCKEKQTGMQDSEFPEDVLLSLRNSLLNKFVTDKQTDIADKMNVLEGLYGMMRSGHISRYPTHDSLINNEGLNTFFNKIVPDHIEAFIASSLLEHNYRTILYPFIFTYFGNKDGYLAYLRNDQFKDSEIVLKSINDIIENRIYLV